MNHFYGLALRNANDLLQHQIELSTFLHTNKIDMLILETHFTCESYLKIHDYNIYGTKHPDGTIHKGLQSLLKIQSNIAR